MADSNTFYATASFTPGAAANVFLEIGTSASRPIEIIRLSVGQVTSVTSAQCGVLFNRCTATTTVWTAATITAGKTNPSGAGASSVVKAYTSGTSTDGTGVTAFYEEPFNVLNGYLYLPVPEERFIVAVSAFLAFKWSTAPPAAAVFKANLVWRELG